MYRWLSGAIKVLLMGALIAMQPGAIALANYAMTVGAGTNFGSIVVGAVHYAQGLVCDQTTVVQCIAVDASGGASVKGEGTAGVASGGVLSVNVVSNSAFPGGNGNLTGFSSNDPCSQAAKQTADFVSPVSGGQIVNAAGGGKFTYLCSISIVTSATANVSLLEGTGSSVCTGGTTAGVFLNTGVTVASGAAFAPNSGISVGAGNGTVARNAVANQNICVAFTTANSPQVNAHVTFVQQ